MAATERIHAAATDLVLRQGIDALDIDAIAARVHCSRATVYRYAGGKTQIRDAVLVGLAARIVQAVRQSVEGLSGSTRVEKAITVALEQIRSDPIRRVLLSSNTVPGLGEMHSSLVLSRLAADLSGVTDDPQAAQWIVRVVLSFAHWPIENVSAEREMLRRFVSPAFN
jgi:AcrR family transcriptional regulator